MSLNIQVVANEDFQSIILHKNPTPKMIPSKRKQTNKFCQDILFSQKKLFCPRIQLSNSQISSLVGLETGILLSDFAQQLRRENTNVPDIYFTLLDAAGFYPTLAPKQNAKAREREEGSFQKMNIRKCKRCTHRSVRKQFSESWQPTSIIGGTVFAFKNFVSKIYSCYA